MRTDTALLRAVAESASGHKNLMLCAAAEIEELREKYEDTLRNASISRSRIQDAHELHCSITLYESCYDLNCEDESHTEDVNGEWMHTDRPLGEFCAECRNEDGDHADYPCATVRALEGESPE